MEQVVELAFGDTEPPRRYVVERRLDDGRVLLRPETEVEAIHRDHGSQRLTEQEFEELIGPYVLPPDDEG